jgi:hypothetical protein
MYTVWTDDGQRDLTLETKLLKPLEEEFSKIRRNKLSKRLSLSSEELLCLCMFAAAMCTRTKAFGTHQSEVWNRVVDMTERMQRAKDEATDEQRANMAKMLSSPQADEKNSFTLEEVRRLAEQPIQEMLPSYVTELGSMLFKTPSVVLETSSVAGFVTSDDPCVWFDPANYRKPPPRGAGGLVSPTIEITVPLSPKQLLFFGHRLDIPGAYVPIANQRTVNELNKRTRIMACEHFVANSPELRAGWF